jgi:DNA repair protein RecN (Recombination protein N)
MLDELSVHNLGLITEAHLELGPGFVVITGETGAGKTLLLGALRLMRGETARGDLIGPAAEETRVEGRVLVDDAELVLTRKVTPGRSRAYLDGAMVPAKALTEKMNGVIEIVSQHDQLSLTERVAVRGLIDAALDAAGTRALISYQDRWQALVSLRHEQELLGGDRRALERELEVVRFQRDEIAAAAFERGNDATLETTANRLRNAEGLAERLEAAANALDESGAADSVDRAVKELRQAEMTDATLGDIVAQAEEVAGLLGDLRAEIAGVAQSLEHDPKALQDVELRLAALAELKRKYGDSLDEVLEFGVHAGERADELEALMDHAEGLGASVSEAEAAVDEAGAALRRARMKAAERLAAAAIGHLTDLGLDAPVVRFDLEPAEPGPHGADAPTLEFASHDSLEPGPVSRIASGGELSRLVLAIRLAAGAEDVAIAAFDEIDSGVGGGTALAVGEKLGMLARTRQVLGVTHLPQVAAFADRHFVVDREGATATVRLVSGDERVEELSRMLAGLPESEKGRDHAAELLALAARS